MKKAWSISAKAAGEIDISIMETIGSDFWTGDGITAKQFSEDLKAAGKVSQINLIVNSGGGSVWDGVAIANTLISHPARVTSHVIGLAASIASVIVMSADPGKISIAESAAVMIHNPHSSTGGDAREFRKLADVLDKVKGSMVGMYRRHSSLSADQISALCDAETWMTAEEAVRDGFASEVTEAADVAASVDLSRFLHVPAEIAARLAGARQQNASVPDAERDRLRLRCRLLERL
jgi:ATP-dependent Clp endopeptidase proteolytic subunit ClpP